MVESILTFISVLRVFFRTRSDTALEVLALRQQVAVLKRKRPRPILNRLDRLFWTTLHACWPRWADVLVIVKPQTVISWHRAGFRLYWRWRSRPRRGPTEDHRGDAWADPPLGARELRLGSAQNPWRTVEARFRCLRTECGPLSATHSAAWRPGETVADLSPESPRGDRRVRFFHRADIDVPIAVLLLCHRARAPQDPALAT